MALPEDDPKRAETYWSPNILIINHVYRYCALCCVALYVPYC